MKTKAFPNPSLMKKITPIVRRDFLKKSSLLLASGILASRASASILSAYQPQKRLFSLCLNPGAIGVKANQKELLQMAIDYGYETIISFPEALAKFSNQEMDDFVGKMKAHRITWGSGGIPGGFRKDKFAYEDSLQELRTLAPALERAGASRMNTWILNYHDELTYRANFQQHAERLREYAKIMGQSGIRMGLEYVAPKTMMVKHRFSFVRTMREARELIAEIGEPNVGLVLDSFHWYCAEDTPEDILSLHPNDIVTCDLNDARADLTRDGQIDGTRELPMASGVINLKAFLDALVEIGYNGPVRAEPFNQPLREMKPSDALTATATAMKKAFALIE